MTPRQRDVFIAVDEFWKKFGCSPTIDDIMFVTGDKGRGNVHRIMRRLCELGICRMIPGRRRTIRPAYVSVKKII